MLTSLKAIPLEAAHEQVEQARRAGEAAWTTLLHPLRTTLSSVRRKLHPCGVEIVAARQRGYLLSPWKGAAAP